MSKTKSIDLLEPILARAFGLTRTFDAPPLLTSLWENTVVLKENEVALLEEVRKKLVKHADSWNEEELKMQFISMVIFLAQFNEPISIYYERDISETIQGKLVKSTVDMLLSKGLGELIETPYFFLHEYKREKKYSGDPVGQMLGGMLIGQAKNANEKPVYGCYVQGRYWYFSVLTEKTYCISSGFDATDETKCKQIVGILRKVRDIILTELMD
ncbi:MAG: hypothetical protein ACKVTZ_15380 [Bacteroidia bacterium]